VNLFDLVTYRRQLQALVNANLAIDRVVELRDNIEGIKRQVPVLDEDKHAYINGLVDYYTQAINMLDQPVVELADKLRELDTEIHRTTHKLFGNNYELETRTGGIENVRSNRRIHVSDAMEQDIKNRIFLHTDWKYPALEIGCRDGEWTQYMVAADPLYIMDQHHEFIDNTVGKFPEGYQRRLRPYVLREQDLSMLPQGQFGFVFSWGFFNYVSVDTMTQFLKNIRQCLRPGGVFMFSYNDGDTPAGAGMAERFSQSYMPKGILIPLACSLGYEVVNDYHDGVNISWLELKRPGELATIKAHQALGVIQRRENF